MSFFFEFFGSPYFERFRDILLVDFWQKVGESIFALWFNLLEEFFLGLTLIKELGEMGKCFVWLEKNVGGNKMQLNLPCQHNNG